MILTWLAVVCFGLPIVLYDTNVMTPGISLRILFVGMIESNLVLLCSMDSGFFLWFVHTPSANLEVGRIKFIISYFSVESVKIRS